MVNINLQSMLAASSKFLSSDPVFTDAQPTILEDAETSPNSDKDDEDSIPDNMVGDAAQDSGPIPSENSLSRARTSSNRNPIFLTEWLDPYI